MDFEGSRFICYSPPMKGSMALASHRTFFLYNSNLTNYSYSGIFVRGENKMSPGLSKYLQLFMIGLLFTVCGICWGIVLLPIIKYFVETIRDHKEKHGRKALARSLFYWLIGVPIFICMMIYFGFIIDAAFQ